MRRKRTFIYIKNKWNLALAILLLSLIGICFLIAGAEIKLRPLVKDIAISRAKFIATRAINDAINDEMQNSGGEYEDVVWFEKDNDGNIIAVKLDITKINRLKAKVVTKVSERLQQTEDMIIKIPIGNIINGEIFSGRGPKISIRLIPIGSVNAGFASEFTSAGINQTRHRILINTNVFISVMLPAGTVGTEVMSEVSIAETVLIGKVPDSYTNIEDNESELLNKINNYVND